MKCEVHPEEEAIGTCTSCGRGVCPICKIVFQGVLHCKACIESGRYLQKPATQVYGAQSYYVVSPGAGFTYPTQVVYPGLYQGQRVPVTPKPIGEPSGVFFKVGAAGTVIGGIGAIICAIYFFLFSTWFSGSNPSDAIIYGVLVSSILFIGTVMSTIGFYGFYRNYGTKSALGFGMVFLICGILFFAIMPFTIKIETTPYYGYPYTVRTYYTVDLLIMYIALLFIGIAAIMCGIGLFIARKYMKNADLPLASGILLIIGGSLFCAYIGLFIIGWIFLAIGFFMLTAVFALAPVPQGEQKSGQYYRPAVKHESPGSQSSFYQSAGNAQPASSTSYTSAPSTYEGTAGQRPVAESYAGAGGAAEPAGNAGSSKPAASADSSSKNMPEMELEKYPYLKSK